MQGIKIHFNTWNRMEFFRINLTCTNLRFMPFKVQRKSEANDFLRLSL